MLKPPQPDYLTLDEAAEYMTAGTKQKWTSKQIIQTAANGEISIWFRVPVSLRLVRTEPLEGEKNEIPAPAGFISRISIAACKSLIAAEVANYDGWDNPKIIDFFGPCKTLVRDWMPAEGEIMPEIRPNDCSVSAAGIKQLLERYTEHAQVPPETAEPDPRTEVQHEGATRRGVTKREILAVDWPLHASFRQGSLENALGDVPDWLCGARMSIGGRGKGKGSNTWNPAALGAALVDRGYASKNAITRVIHQHFDDWLDDWELAERGL